MSYGISRLDSNIVSRMSVFFLPKLKAHKAGVYGQSREVAKKSGRHVMVWEHLRLLDANTPFVRNIEIVVYTLICVEQDNNYQLYVSEP
jgi:hypothetical protein